MGTRSTYRFIEQYKDDRNDTNENHLALVYFQYDGYPSGHPSETAEWLVSGEVVNGFGIGVEKLQFNGAGCLVAQFISKYKNGVGGVYVNSLDSRGKCWEDYLYDVIVKLDNSIEYVCYENDETPREIFRGSPKDFLTKYSREVEVE